MATVDLLREVICLDGTRPPNMKQSPDEATDSSKDNALAAIQAKSIPAAGRRETFEEPRNIGASEEVSQGVAASLTDRVLKAAAEPAKDASAAMQPDDDDSNDLGRGKRKLKPTTKMLGGFAVKRSNMYDMEGGERSVWDQELNGEVEDGVARPSYAPPLKRPAAPRGPKVQSAEEVARLSRNEVLRQCRAAATVKQTAFLQPYRAIMERFGAHVPATTSDAVALEDSTLQQPAQLRVTMRDYQVRGLRWLSMMHKNGINTILADEMGLGKTLQTIAFLAHLKFDLDEPGPHLVVAPLSVLSSWMSEINRFCPSLRGVKLHSADADERKRLIQSLAHSPHEFDVVVTTYEMVKSPQLSSALGSRTWWRYLVIDEGHVLKNELSQISQALRKLHFVHALLLTGTPLQNNLHELWAILNFLHPGVFPQSSAAKFDNAFQLGTKHLQVDNEQLAAAALLMRPLMLRRTKDEVEKRLPPKLETTIACPLSEMQLFWYKRLLLRESALLRQLEAENEEHASGGTDWKKLQSLLMQLRKCCNHPFLFSGAEPSADETYEEQLVNGSGKFQVLSRLLAKLFAGGHRVVLFSQFTSTLDLLEDFLNHVGYKYCRLDGGTNRVQRTVDINAFNMEGSKRFVFLMSTRAGGLGINCQTADTCILFDSDWNPQVDMQAMARVHRIGQKKVVHMYRLVSSGTVEERIVQRAEKKLYLDQMVNRGSSAQSEKLDELSKSEMMGMLKFGAQCCFAAAAAPTDAQLDAIICRTRTAADSVHGIAGGKQHSAADFDASAPLVEMRTLQGATYGEAKRRPADGDAKTLESLSGLLSSGGGAASTMADIGEEWERIRSGKRQHKSRFSTVHVTGVGQVNVLAENDYCMGDDMPNKARVSMRDKPQGRQVAGRDFAHARTCLRCWRPGAPRPAQPTNGNARATGVGGTLRGCDICPAAYHLECVGIDPDDAGGWGLWACPHHSCATCGRKATAAGGLLFRCTVCPQAFCEDHLPPESLIMGECERFQALGCRHPKQGCYIQCSGECAEKSKELGLGSGDGSAASILGATGFDTTAAKGSKAAPPPPLMAVDDRGAWERLSRGVASAITALLRLKPCSLAAASHELRERALSKQTHDSTVDLLHDIVFDTDLWNTNALLKSKKRKAAGADVPTSVEATVGRIGTWRGAAAERDHSAVSQADKEAAAEMYLNLVRRFEGMKSNYVTHLAALVGVQRLNARCELKNRVQGLGRQSLAPVLALLLTLPHPQALVLDERAGQANGKFVKERGGDPGFLVNGPPLKWEGHTYRMSATGLQQVYRSRPVYGSGVVSRPVVYPNHSFSVHGMMQLIRQQQQQQQLQLQQQQ